MPASADIDQIAANQEDINVGLEPRRAISAQELFIGVEPSESAFFQVSLELWKSQPQGWSHDPRGRVMDRYCQELRLCRKRAESRFHGTQAVQAILEPDLLIHSGHSHIQIRDLSSYEVFEALRRGTAVPIRKQDAENKMNISELKACDYRIE